MFRAPAILLPHESTVAHQQRFKMDEPSISRSRSVLRPIASIDSSVMTSSVDAELPHLRETTTFEEDVNVSDIRELSPIISAVMFFFI